MTTKQTMFALVAHLLGYPDQAWRAALPELREEAEQLADPRSRETIMTFIEQAVNEEAGSWQHLYVRTFDFGKKSNLYLTYIQYGEERERGPALVALKRQYGAVGLQPVAGELPDYLPLVLEFAAQVAPDVSGPVLGDLRPAIAAIREALDDDHPYTSLIELLLAEISPSETNQVAQAGSGIQ